MGTNTKANAFNTPDRKYVGWKSMSILLRKRGHQPSHIGHVVSVEKTSEMPERLEVLNRLVGLDSTIEPEWMLVERHVTDEGYVGRITRIINTTAYTSHFELHLAARSWMLCQTYPMDFAPNSCGQCPLGKADDDWLSTYLAVWINRLRPVSQVS